MRREWIEMKSGTAGTIKSYCLPPCGGSGLKCLMKENSEEIEVVSLHAEGVD